MMMLWQASAPMEHSKAIRFPRGGTSRSSCPVLQEQSTVSLELPHFGFRCRALLTRVGKLFPRISHAQQLVSFGFVLHHVGETAAISCMPPVFFSL
jgi:hypothetical protein